MTDKFGGSLLPSPPFHTPAFPPSAAPGDPLLGYLGDFLSTIIHKYAGATWLSIQPNKPIIRTVITSDPDEGFVENELPALYVYRPGRETRELVESFTRIADDYYMQKSRVVAQWIHDPLPNEQRQIRNNIIDLVRKAVAAAVDIGRDPAWLVPGDDAVDGLGQPLGDPKSKTFGSSLLIWSGASVIELGNAAPGDYVRKMTLPVPPRRYNELKLSFNVEEFLDRDLSLIGGPHTTLEAHYKSPDQGTGLGTFDLGDEIYGSDD